MDSEFSFDGFDDVNLICGNSVGVELFVNCEYGWLIEENCWNYFIKKVGFGLVDVKFCSDKNVFVGLSFLMDYNLLIEFFLCDLFVKIDVRVKSGVFNFFFVSGFDLLVFVVDWD